MHRVGLALFALFLAAACSGADDNDAVAGGSGQESITKPMDPSVPTSATTVPTSTKSMEPQLTTSVESAPTITTLVTFGGEEPPVVVSQPVSCDSEPGSPTDLKAEPVEWLAFGRYLRWTDEAGCLVRVDVISHIHGAEHCEWASAEFISIGRPFGESINRKPREDTVNRYIWDPQRVLPGGPDPDSLAVDDLPSTVFDTGYRQGEKGLWLDSADDTVLFVVYQGRADIWIRNPGRGICA
jgi:hypothetical protein